MKIIIQNSGKLHRGCSNLNPIQDEEEEDSDTVVISDHEGEGEEDNSVVNDEEALQDCYE